MCGTGIPKSSSRHLVGHRASLLRPARPERLLFPRSSAVGMHQHCPPPQSPRGYCRASAPELRKPAVDAMPSHTNRKHKSQFGPRIRSSYVFLLRKLKALLVRGALRDSLLRLAPPLPCKIRRLVPVFIAVLIAFDAARGIPVAKRAAAFIVAVLGPELCAVEGSEQSSATHLPRDRGQRILRSRRPSGSVLRGIVHACPGAAVGVAHQYAPKFVHRDVVEIEQVSARVTAALVPNAATLHEVGWCRVRGRPCTATVVGERDVQMPDAGKISRLRIACGWRSQKRESRAIVIAGDYFGELRVLNPKRRPRVFGLRPVQSAVLRSGDFRVAVAVDVSEVYGVITARSHRGIAARADARTIWYGFDDPAQPIVTRHGHSRPADAIRVHALLVRNVSRTIQGNANVTVQPATGARSNRPINSIDGRKEVDRHTRSKRKSAVIASRTKCCGDVLRTVINRVRIGRARHRHR